MQVNEHVHGLFNKERRLWIAGILASFFLGCAIMNGIATKDETDYAWDRWWHAINKPQEIGSKPDKETTTLAPKE